MVRSLLDHGYRTARRITVAVVGGSVVLVGVAMLVLPGPAFVVIPAGLAILAIEFAWARRWLHAVKARAEAMLPGSRGDAAGEGRRGEEPPRP
jgi:tellurite resistance protein TerC